MKTTIKMAVYTLVETSALILLILIIDRVTELEVQKIENATIVTGKNLVAIMAEEETTSQPTEGEMVALG